MKYARTVAFLTMLAMTTAILVLMTSTADSLAQNDATRLGNQSSSAGNETAIDNQTGSGNISGVMHRLA